MPSTDPMFFDRKAAFWVTSTLLVCMFVIFIILAVLVTPKPALDHADIVAGSDTEYLVDAIQDLNNMVWWMTVSFIMLPIMLLLLFLALFFLFTSKDDRGPKPAPTGTSFLGPRYEVRPASDAKPQPAVGQAAPQIDPSDALDLRYARGEVTREQYAELQKDLKKARL